MRSIRRSVRAGALFWGSIYALLVLMPLLVASASLGGPRPSGWWFDFSMGLGFGALSLLGGQFMLTARFRRATAPFGIDVVYLFHRWLGVIGVGLVVVHYGILRLRYPATLAPALPPDAPWHMTAGRVALLAFGLLVASSLLRKRFGIEYDWWRVAHIGLAVAGMALAAVHVLGVGYHSSPFWNRLVLDAFFASTLALAIYMRFVKPVLTQSLPYRVAAVRPEAGAWTLRLEPVDHATLRFDPGQFGWLSLATPPWKAREHPFSFSGSAEDRGGLECTIKELGNFTSTVGRTPVGTPAWIDGPHGAFSIDRHPGASGFLFVAGGVGVAPIMSMLRTMADRNDARPVGLVYGARSHESALFAEELDALRTRLDLRTTLVLQEPPPGWSGPTGVPHPALIETVLDALPEGAHAFLCGPVPLTAMAERTLRAAGMPLRRIHLELFDMA